MTACTAPARAAGTGVCPGRRRPLPAVLPGPGLPPRGPLPAGRGRLHRGRPGRVPRTPGLRPVPAGDGQAGEPRASPASRARRGRAPSRGRTKGPGQGYLTGAEPAGGRGWDKAQGCDGARIVAGAVAEPGLRWAIGRRSPRSLARRPCREAASPTWPRSQQVADLPCYPSRPFPVCPAGPGPQHTTGYE